MKKNLTTLCLLLPSLCLHAQSDSMVNKKWSVHGQLTVIPQAHLNFSAPYTGKNSMQTAEPPKVSLTSTLFVGRRLWKNAIVYINPELSGGSGLSKATGAAGFPNGETFRIG